MSNALTSGAWHKDPDAYDPQARVREFTLNGREFTAHSLQGPAADHWSVTVREAGTCRYVATVSNWTALPGQLSARLDAMQPQSGYAPCACRDCMETIVAKNPARPELCDDCHTAGCGDPDATTWPECQRDDAYGEC